MSVEPGQISWASLHFMPNPLKKGVDAQQNNDGIQKVHHVWT